MVLLPLPLWPTRATNSFCGDAEGRFLHRLELLRAAEQPAANAVVLLQLFDLQDDAGGRFRG